MLRGRFLPYGLTLVVSVLVLPTVTMLLYAAPKALADTVLYQQTDYTTAVYSGWTGNNTSPLYQALGNQLSSIVTSIGLKVSCPQGGTFALSIYDSNTPYNPSTGMGDSTLLWSNGIACPGGQTTTPTDVSIPISLATTGVYPSPTDLNYDGLVLNPSKYYYIILAGTNPGYSPLYLYGSNDSNAWKTSDEDAFVCNGWYCLSFTTGFYSGLRDIFFSLQTAPPQTWPLSNVKFGFGNDDSLRVSFDWVGPSRNIAVVAGFNGTVSIPYSSFFSADPNKDVSMNFEECCNMNTGNVGWLKFISVQSGNHYDLPVSELHFWKPYNVLSATCNFWTGGYPCLPPNRSQMETMMGRVLEPDDYITLAFEATGSPTYKVNDPTKYYFAQPPTLSNLSQYKSDSIMPIGEGDTTTEDTVVVKGVPTSPSGNQVQLQIELRQTSENNGQFTGQPTANSASVTSGTTASITVPSLINGQYHWQARAVDSQGSHSDWQAFGTPGSTDFVVHQVPLYTQVESDFPSRTQTILWSKVTDIYGTGNYKDCKDPISNLSTIRSCGCAITSSVMALRFYIVRPASGEDVNPKTINDWLKLNSGYSSVGDLVWPQLVAYSGGSLSYKFSDKDSDLLNSELAAGHPVILAESTTDPGKAGHFIVADGQLAQTYTIRDPRWYKTRFLTQAVADIQTERNYSNNFLSMRLLTPVIGQNIVPDAIYVSLASPAEFLITDPNGRRLGKDPVTGVSFNEIPDGAYYREGISGGTPENPTPPHESKIVWIPTPATGQYNLQVIGTGNGSYTLDSLIYDAQGNTHPQIFTGIAETNLVTDFNLNFTPNQPENIVVKPADKIPPEAKIFFDKDNKHVKVEGVDNITQPGPSVERQNNLYTIRDAAENILKLSFEKVKQEGREIKAELESLQYNIQPIIELPKTDLKFEWSVDKDTQQIKKLKQNIEVRNQFEIKAKYNLQKNETEIKIERGRGKERELSKQALPGLVIIKLTTKSGALDFEF